MKIFVFRNSHIIAATLACAALPACAQQTPTVTQNAVAATSPRAEFNVLDSGAKPNDGAFDTAAIQRAIDAAAGAGGGTVVVPAGTFDIVSLQMKSDITLRLDEGAVLKSTGDWRDFGAKWDWNSALIKGKNLKNVTLTGSGTIDGSNLSSPTGEAGTRGAHMISLLDCQNLKITDLKLKNAGNYTLHLNGLRSGTIESVAITGGWDGLHIRYASDVTVKNFSVLNNTDDGIAGHSNSNFRFENISIDGGRANGWRWGCDGLVARNVTVKNKSEYALKHFSPIDGGEWVGHALESDNWQIENWTVENCGGFFYYKYGENWQGARPLGAARFKNVRATELHNANIVIGPADRRVADLRFEDCLFAYQGRAAVGFDWPPYGFFATNADKIELRNVAFFYNNAEDRAVVRVENSNLGLVENVRYKPTVYATPFEMNGVDKATLGERVTVSVLPGASEFIRRL